MLPTKITKISKTLTITNLITESKVSSENTDYESNSLEH